MIAARSSTGVPRQVSVSRTDCPGSSSAGTRVARRSSRVRPNSPRAVSRALGRSVTWPVLRRVYDTVAVPVPKSSGRWRPTLSPDTASAGSVGPLTRRYTRAPTARRIPSASFPPPGSVRSSSATIAPGWSPGSAPVGTRSVNGTVTVRCPGTVIRLLASRAHAPTPRIVSSAVRTAKPPSRGVL